MTDTSPYADINAVLQTLNSGERTAVEVTQGYFDAIDDRRSLNVYVCEMRQEALAKAAESDKRLADGTARALEGVPVAVKDNYCTAGTQTTAGSEILKGFVPTYESTVTQKLRDAGAVILGKVNLDEFAMGSSTETSCFGPTVNPVGVDLGMNNLVPGGSSGGSAAAVAGGLAAAALGTDTGGSIRQPASFCGLVGFKPTYGVCSRWGIIAYGSSLDQAGPFGRTVDDVTRVMDVISGTDEKDTTSISEDIFDFKTAKSTLGEKPVLGLPKEIMALEKTADTTLVWERAQELAAQTGAELVEISLPNFSHALPSYYILALCEASSNLARYDGVRYGHRTASPANIEQMYEQTRAEGFGSEVQKRIMLGTFALSAGFYDAYFVRAQKVRQLVAGDFREAFKKVDAIVMPTAPSSAFAMGSHADDAVSMYLQDVFTVPVNLAGLPAISIPAAKSANGMPLGLQIIGPQFADRDVLSIAAKFEAAAG